MKTTTSNTHQPGTEIHKFELAGLGKAPYTFVGVTEKTYQACSGAPIQAGGCCDYCSNGIRYVYSFRSADGKTFGVGCDCALTYGDSGMRRVISDAERKLKQSKQKTKHDAILAELTEIIAVYRDKLAAMPHSRGFKDFKTGLPMTFLDEVEWLFDNAGMAGHLRLLKQLKQILGV